MATSKPGMVKRNRIDITEQRREEAYRPQRQIDSGSVERDSAGADGLYPACYGVRRKKIGLVSRQQSVHRVRLLLLDATNRTSSRVPRGGASSAVPVACLHSLWLVSAVNGCILRPPYIYLSLPPTVTLPFAHPPPHHRVHNTPHALHLLLHRQSQLLRLDAAPHVHRPVHARRQDLGYSCRVLFAGLRRAERRRQGGPR
jgi:hypothetical protein